MPDAATHVIKLGGSLLDLPDLRERWAVFAESGLAGTALLVVGGGRAADTVRAFDKRFGLDETAGHWLAVHAMAFNARLVAAAMPDAAFVSTVADAEAAWNRRQIAVIDPVAWLEDAEHDGDGVPHRWVFTSDSIAAHIATSLHAQHLTLLKSTLLDRPRDVVAAAAVGLVDESFPDASAGVPAIDVINFRHDPPSASAARCVLR